MERKPDTKGSFQWRRFLCIVLFFIFANGIEKNTVLLVQALIRRMEVTRVDRKIFKANNSLVEDLPVNLLCKAELHIHSKAWRWRLMLWR